MKKKTNSLSSLRVEKVIKKTVMRMAGNNLAPQKRPRRSLLKKTYQRLQRKPQASNNRKERNSRPSTSAKLPVCPTKM